MINSLKIYSKNKEIVRVHSKFIYCSEVYQIWGWGAALVEEKYYSSNKPITLRKKDLVVKRRKYSLYRFFNLEFAPEEYLINNGFKIIENETGCD